MSVLIRHRRRHDWRPSRLILLTVVLAVSSARASKPLAAADSPLGGLLDLFFGGRKDEAVEIMVPVAEAVAVELDPNAGSEFLPLLFKCSARELYFLKKVTQPADEAYAELRIAAAQAARDLARQYAREQRANKGTEQWPRPRPFMTDALAERAAQLLPAEQVAEYRAEVTAREAAQTAACQGMLLRAIDNRITLLPDQVEPTRQAVAKHWESEQSTNLMTYLYEEYLQFPDANLLAKTLTERQRRVLNSGSHGRIGFSWEQELGLQGWQDMGLEIAGLEDLSKVVVKAPVADERKEPAGQHGDDGRPLPAEAVRKAAPVAGPAAAAVEVAQPVPEAQP